MTAVVRDWMQVDVRTVPTHLPLAELDERFLRDQVTGFPVTSKDGKLIGIASRSDVVRQLSVQQTWAETVSDYYRDWTGFETKEPSLEEIGERMGRRLENLTVNDVMARAPITVAPDLELAEAARLM
ncbi:MAG: CBS domain-containing protein, partial [Myxococcales bacterium]|nr:CBS domain-containing protein [Myxococcales bacterium]